MNKINVYYHKQTNTWWTDSNLSGIPLRKELKTNPSGLGTIEIDTLDKSLVSGNNLHEVEPMYIPNFFKMLNGLTVDGLEEMLEESENNI